MARGSGTGTSLLLASAGALAWSAAAASTLAPDPVLPSALTLRLEHAGNLRGPGASTNIAEPVAIGGALYVIDQGARTIAIAGAGGAPRVILDAGGVPAGVTPAGGTAFINMAGADGRAFVGFHSSTLPTGFATPAPLPDDPRYVTPTPRFDLIYAYTLAPDGTLTDPRPVAAFEATTNGHRGGGMLVLPDGRLLYARGDNLGPDHDGLAAPQDPTSTLSKLLILDADTGAVEIAAMGIRNVQHMTYSGASRDQVLFSDIGWTVAEEINAIGVDGLLDVATVENFGWGRDADGLAREGGFYVSEGPESATSAIGLAPLDEPGFVQPFAQFGRDGATGFFAVSGPLTSTSSFDRIGALFGDLAGGSLYATLAGASGTFNDVFAVSLVDEFGQPTDLQARLGISRIDLRLFNHADGGAGLLSERSGDFFRLSEIAAVPLPSGAPMLAFALLAAAGLRRILGQGSCRRGN